LHRFAASRFLSRDPLAEVWIAIRQCDASGFALSEKSHAVLTSQSQLLEVKNDTAIIPFGGDESLKLGNVLFVDPAAQGKYYVPIRLPANFQHSVWAQCKQGKHQT
jgi:hypothetical protein